MVSSIGLMEESSKVIGLTENKMEKEFSLTRQARNKKVINK